MRIAVAYENGCVLDYFERLTAFRIYEVSDRRTEKLKDRAIVWSEPEDVMEKLIEWGVGLMICGSIDEHGMNAARAKGIMFIRDVLGYADEAAEGFAFGYLEPDERICTRYGN